MTDDTQMPSYRPLIVTLDILTPIPTTDVTGANSENATLDGSADNSNTTTRGSTRYRKDSVVITENLIEFNATLDAGNKIFWSGTIVLADFSTSGTAVTSRLGSIGPDTILSVRFGVEDRYAQSPSDKYANAPAYEGAVMKINYNLRPEGVVISCELAGQTQDQASREDYVAKVKKSILIKGREEYDRAVAAATDQVKTGGLAIPNVWFDKIGNRVVGDVAEKLNMHKPPTPSQAFRMIAAAAGWTNLVVEDIPENQSKFVYVVRNIEPKPGDTYLSVANRLAETSVNGYGENFLFYITPGINGPVHHFHTPGWSGYKVVEYHY